MAEDMDVDLLDVQREIDGVQRKIDEVESQLSIAKDPEDKRYLREKEKQLREKEKQLRDEKMQLREKEMQLRALQLEKEKQRTLAKVPPATALQAAPASVAFVDHSAGILKALAQPFDEPIHDSPEGIRQMLNQPLPTRLPVGDYLYDRITSPDLKRQLVPFRELPACKLGDFFGYVLQGGTEIPSEASCESKWNDLTWKPMREVLNGTAQVVSITIDRNVTNPTGTTLIGKRPDMSVQCGELVYDQEEQQAGSLALPTKELFEKLSGLDPIYHANATRSYIVGAATSGNTIAYYALHRSLRTPPVPVLGPLLVTTPDMVFQVLRCSFNVLRFAVTVGLERGGRSLKTGLVLGHRDVKRYLGITRSIEYFPDHVQKTITPFSSHRALGLTTLEYAEKAYAAAGDWGKAWSVRPPEVTEAGVYSVQVQPLGVEKPPESEDELRIAIRCVLNGIKALHVENLVHRDIRWPNILNCGPVYFVMDFETVWKADEKPVCLPLAHWAGMPLRSGCYTKECDLWLVGKLLQRYHYSTPSYNSFKAMLSTSLTPQSLLAVEEVLGHEWLL